MAASFLTVLSNAEAVQWVFSQERMAFSEHTGKRISSQVSHGDRLYFYIGTKCWPRLGGDRPRSGMIVGDAVVLTDCKTVACESRNFGRMFSYGCQLLFERLAALGSGVPLSEMVDQLDLLSGKHNYGYLLRRTPVLLSQRDAELLRSQLDAFAVPFENAASGYLAPKRV